MNRAVRTTLAALTCGLAVTTVVFAQGTTSARAVVHDASGAQIGLATLEQTDAGVRLVLDVTSLAPGRHGVHIHSNGSCADSTNDQGQVVAFGGAGGHFDPNETGHHGGPATHSHDGHAGDMPNIEVGADGTGTLTVTTDKVTLEEGALSIIGRSIVIHANEDNYTDEPALGGSGPRVACGVIEAAAGSN